MDRFTIFDEFLRLLEDDFPEISVLLLSAELDSFEGLFVAQVVVEVFGVDVEEFSEAFSAPEDLGLLALALINLD